MANTYNVTFTTTYSATNVSENADITWVYADSPPPKTPKQMQQDAYTEYMSDKAKVKQARIDRRDEVIASWGIDQTLDLSQLAADFYLLYELSLSEEDEGHFEPLLYGLVDQFASYTDMILGGELRYIKDRARSRKDVIAPELWEIFYAKEGEMSTRHEYWDKWREFRAIHPDALQWAADAFNTFESSGVGGPKWANIADMLRIFLDGTITPLMFVDFCWGLEHNGGTYFNKVWSNQVKHVLEANLNGAIESVLAAASPGIRKFYRSKR
ncbi:hypothetical protein CMI37_15705 [Candidatus Pacearchaeota archaeon]|nr:hypothetical protein [Candidatus Pacearchaeota archaeon]|tara:strand:+ start:1739 stop:2545 length:807 start_codon:yes stop_codon:yes gene_type:complete